MARDGGVERVVDQRRLARAGHACDADEQTDRQIERDVFQIVAAGIRHHQLPLGIGLTTLLRNGNATSSGQILAGE